ncbi:cytochrome c [Lyngbya sp. PCC 8106]|uniref:c-type cytochrome n=1 Tax=Lyngbya sp. (strain PCC 8106) TaxID=313612 RepID=UPI0000EAA866|nr:Cytochrome c, class I [Lyngbya sp. PCC 8106]
MLLILLWVFGLNLLQVSDPYIEQVLSLDGNPVKGHAIFEMNCAGCHFQKASDQVGPSLLDVSQRKSPVGIIHQVTSGKTPPMPQFQPTPQEMADLLSYLQKL